MVVCYIQVHAGEDFRSVVQFWPQFLPLQQWKVCSGTSLRLKYKNVMLLCQTQCDWLKRWKGVLVCLVTFEPPPCVLSVSSETLRCCPAWERWRLESGCLLVCHVPFITDIRKLLSSAPVFAVRSLQIFFFFFVCVCYRQANGVCQCGAHALHEGLHGAVWSNLFLRHLEAHWACS